MLSLLAPAAHAHLDASGGLPHLADDSPDLGLSFWQWVALFVSVIALNTNVIPDEGPWPATLWTFVGIAGSFLITRGITRYIRMRGQRGGPVAGPVRDIVIGGVHIHHQVFGIVLMALSGICLVAISPVGVALNVLALALGVGIGLAFDEFALWLHLDDVYWREQGRKSIDAVAIALVTVGQITVIVGLAHDLSESGAAETVLGPVTVWIDVVVIVLTFVPAVLCLLKGKPMTAGAGVVYLPIGLIGMVRLAKPGSWWAVRFYGPGGRRARRSARRFDQQYQARWNKFRDLVGGAPNPPD